MYIDFMDTLRNIQNGIYPQIKGWYVDIKDSVDANNHIKDEILVIQEEILDTRCDTKAYSFESESWANEAVDVPVKEYKCDHECDKIYSTDRENQKFSSKHWAMKSKELSEGEKWEAQAAQMTAWSFANEDIGIFVNIYTSNGDGTFASQELKDIYSAKHYAKETEYMSGQKRWVETQEALQCQTKFLFTKNINHSDVYINGVRQVQGECYTNNLTEIDFKNELNAGDKVTVSGMEAVTGDYYQNSIEELKKLVAEGQMAQAIAEASRKTAQSFTSEPSGQTVKIYTVDSNGQIKVTDTTLFSALHWSEQINELKSGIMVVDLYADLDTLSYSDAKTVYVRGGLSVNDGRQGMFIYDQTNTCKTNGGTVINGYVREFSGPVNVRWFLAEGDGVKNDTKYIKKALEISDHILLPKGTYLVDKPLKFENVRVEADEVTILVDLDKGRAITCQNMKYGQGIIGSMLVDWYGSSMHEEKVSYFIQGCTGATFDIGSKDSVIGIQVDPEFGDTVDNIFNLNLLKDNTVGIYIGNTYKRYNATGNRFNGGDFIFEKSLIPVHSHFDIASFIYIDGEEKSGTIFDGPSFEAKGRTNEDFLLFRINGGNVLLKPSDVEVTDFDIILGKAIGKDIILDFSSTPNLTSYLDKSFEADGYISNIDIEHAKDITIIGRSNVHADAKKSFETITDGPKPSVTTMNLQGLAGYFPVENNKRIIQLEDMNGGSSMFLSPEKVEFVSTTTGDHTYIGQGKFEITDGITQAIFTKKGFKLNVLDGVLPFDKDINISVSQADISSGINQKGIYSENSKTQDKIFISPNKIVSVGDGDQETLELSSKKLKFDSIIDNANTEITRNNINISDGVKSVNITPENIIMTGHKITSKTIIPNDDMVLVERGENNIPVMKIKNTKKGGALVLDVNNDQAPALRIVSGGKTTTELRGGDTWIIDGKKIQWHGVAIPTSGIWEVGDIVFGDEPIVNGNIGWVCIQQGRPGKWKPFGKVDIFNHAGEEWRNEEVNFDALDRQKDFLLTPSVKRARIFINGVRLRDSEFVVKDSATGTKVSLHTECAENDWVVIEF